MAEKNQNIETETKEKFGTKVKNWWQRNKYTVANTALTGGLCVTYCYVGYQFGKIMCGAEWQKLVDAQLLTPTRVAEDGSLEIINMADKIQWSKVAEEALKKKN